MAQKPKTKREKVIAALSEVRIATHACKKAGISTSTFYRWRKDDSAFDLECREAIEEGTKRISDMAESVLISKIQK